MRPSSKISRSLGNNRIVRVPHPKSLDVAVKNPTKKNNMNQNPLIYNRLLEEETPQERSVAMMEFRRRSFTVIEALEDEAEAGEEESTTHLPQHHLFTHQEATPKIREQEEEDPDQADKSFDAIVNRLVPKPLPAYFVLGHCTIEVGATRLPHVLHRICSFIQKASVDFQVFPKEGRIDCRAHSFLSFCIWIWKNERDNGNIIIELQRRQGCGVLMQRYRKAFTNYLQSGTDFNPETLNRCTFAMPSVARRPFSRSTSQGSETVGRCRSMLESDSDEQKRLALENLLLILNSPSVNPETTQKVAHRILVEQNQNNNQHTTLLDEISYFFVCNQRRKSKCCEGDSCDFEETEFEEGHTRGVLHNLALQVLASALEVAVGAGPQSLCSLDVANPPWRTIVGAMCYNVSNAATRPQEAALSARCLSLLDELTDHCVMTTVLEHSRQILPCLFSAQQYGSVHNQFLSREVRTLLEKIEDRVEDGQDS